MGMAAANCGPGTAYMAVCGTGVCGVCGLEVVGVLGLRGLKGFADGFSICFLTGGAGAAAGAVPTLEPGELFGTVAAFALLFTLELPTLRGGDILSMLLPLLWLLLLLLFGLPLLFATPTSDMSILLEPSDCCCCTSC